MGQADAACPEPQEAALGPTLGWVMVSFIGQEADEASSIELESQGPNDKPSLVHRKIAQVVLRANESR